MAHLVAAPEFTPKTAKGAIMPILNAAHDNAAVIVMCLVVVALLAMAVGMGQTVRDNLTACSSVKAVK